MRALPGEAQRLVREFVAREGKLAPDHRARVAKQLAERLRPYATDVDPGQDDVELIRAIARSLRASAESAENAPSVYRLVSDNSHPSPPTRRSPP